LTRPFFDEAIRSDAFGIVSKQTLRGTAKHGFSPDENDALSALATVKAMVLEHMMQPAVDQASNKYPIG